MIFILYIHPLHELSTQARQKLLPFSLFPIFMIVFVDILGFGITVPVLPLYAQNEFGASAMQITGIATAYFTAQFIASPRLGKLSDRIGRRPVLILSQAGTLIAFLLKWIGNRFADVVFCAHH